VSGQTSSGLRALVIGALSERAPELIPPGISMPDCALAHAPAAPMRTLLATALERFGPDFILGMGQQVRRMGFEPVLHVLLRSEAPDVLVAKWQRFEQFTRMSHRTEFAASDRSLVLTRHGRPTPGENLLIYGLLIALIEEIGCEGVEADFSAAKGGSVPPIDGGGRCVPACGRIGASDRVVLSWRRFERRVRAEPSGLAGKGQSRPPLLFYGGNERTPYARRAVARLASDISRAWSLDALASDIGVSGRTLQRRLADEGTSLTEILKAVRIREACHLLTGSGLSLTEIGYWCGYSDGPHFSRQFSRALGMSPRTYRRAAA